MINFFSEYHSNYLLTKPKNVYSRSYRTTDNLTTGSTDNLATGSADNLLTGSAESIYPLEFWFQSNV